MDDPSDVDLAPGFRARALALRRRLARPLPGAAALRPMMVSDRPWIPVAEARAAGCREAAVLVLVYPVAGRARTVVTLRPDCLSDHAGQISFPGGRLEDGEDSVACAMREAAEELGVEPDGFEVLGSLTPFFIPPSGFCVEPVVVASQRRPAFAADPREVSEVIEVELADLDTRNVRVETWESGGRTRQVPLFAIGDHKIWGATGMMLAELASVWRDAAQDG